MQNYVEKVQRSFASDEIHEHAVFRSSICLFFRFIHAFIMDIENLIYMNIEHSGKSACNYIYAVP